MDEPVKSDIFQDASKAVKFLRSSLPSDLHHPEIGIVCGSGLGALQNLTDAACRFELSYDSIPYFPKSTVEGHEGKLLFGKMEPSQPALALMVGRAHFYEGGSIHDTAFPIRVLALLGIKTLISTNAAGALNTEYRVGDIVLFSDHLNLAGLAGIHPLRGPNLHQFGTRFPPLSNAYDLYLRRMVHQVWALLSPSQKQCKLWEGTYAFVGGPSFETRAECRALKLLGADTVGMSTVAENIVARHCGINVLAMSVVTNRAQLEPGPKGDDPSIQTMTRQLLQRENEDGMANHKEVLEVGMQTEYIMQTLVARVVQQVLEDVSCNS